ncbi:hypothetical protein BT69DRAFT_1030065 [Atractiella rhizophila]|nr:hypothetical protein BT69DRAFT_1030065 [Atractiella rhizophila]
MLFTFLFCASPTTSITASVPSERFPEKLREKREEQNAGLPVLQNLQAPQCAKERITESPGATWVTEEPICCTSRLHARE